MNASRRVRHLEQGVDLRRAQGKLLPIKRVAVLLGLGSLGLLIMSLHQPVWYLVGLFPAFGFGWAWPGLFNLSVVRNNPSAPAAASGITQAGVYVGSTIGPAAGGWIIQQGGYSALWLAAAAQLAAAALIAVALRLLVRRARETKLAQKLGAAR